LLEPAIAAAVRAADWNAVLEAEGPQRQWRADILATSLDGRRRVAWEAQLAHQHDDTLDVIVNDKAPQSLLDVFGVYRDV
jgi:hypothetical protein